MLMLYSELLYLAEMILSEISPSAPYFSIRWARSAMLQLAMLLLPLMKPNLCSASDSLSPSTQVSVTPRSTILESGCLVEFTLSDMFLTDG